MAERPIKAVIVQPSSHGRRVVNLRVVLESFGAMAKDHPSSKRELFNQEINLIEIDEDTLTPDTEIAFGLKGPWGDLKIQYTPGQAAVGGLARTFNETVGGQDALDIMKCTEGAFVLLLKKLSENLGDAMEGLLNETVYETLAALVGRQIQGQLNRKGMRDRIANKQAELSRKRMGATRGKVAKAEDFANKASQAAALINGKITREKLAEKMGTSVQSLDRQIRNHNYTWPQLREFLASRVKKTLPK